MNKKDPLVALISSLSKSEKRNFRLFARRNTTKGDLKFLTLFDAIDKAKDTDDASLLQKLKSVKRIQLSNLKANLYRQILASLRQYHLQQNEDIVIREQLDFARVLYNKGLYKQALKLLDKAKNQALQHQLETLALEILEFEKHIESQYITRSFESTAEYLTEQSNSLTKRISLTNKLSDLALNFYGLYLKMGHIRGEKDYRYIKLFKDTHLVVEDESQLSFLERLYYYQSHVWYYFILQDFVMCYRYAQKWVDLFEEQPKLKIEQRTSYLKGIHNLLNVLFYLSHYDKLCEVLEQLEKEFRASGMHETSNTEMLLFLYYYTALINKHFMEGSFQEATEIVPKLEEEIVYFSEKLDPQRTLVFYYKIGCIYFGNGQFKEAITYLQKVIDYKDVHISESIHCFARILSLIAHYEAGLDEKLESQIKSTYHFLKKMRNLQAVQLEIIQFMRKMHTLTPENVKSQFIQLKDRLAKHENDPYEKRPFMYLDIISWLESKIENKPVASVIQEKFRQKEKAA